MSALVTLGWTQAQAQEAVRRVADDAGDGTSIEDLVKRALARIGRVAVVR